MCFPGCVSCASRVFFRDSPCAKILKPSPANFASPLFVFFFSFCRCSGKWFPQNAWASILPTHRWMNISTRGRKKSAQRQMARPPALLTAWGPHFVFVFFCVFVLENGSWMVPSYRKVQGVCQPDWTQIPTDDRRAHTGVWGASTIAQNLSPRRSKELTTNQAKPRHA